MGSMLINALGGSLLGGISELIGKFKLDPETKAKLQMAVQENAALIAEKQMEMDAALVESVNATMRAEAGAEHWATWLWRPLVGFTFSLVVLNNYVLLPYFATSGLQPIQIPGELWTCIMVILGAAAAGRSAEKIVSAWQSKSAGNETG